MASDNYLFFLIFDYLTIIYAVIVEEFKQSIFILLISIRTKIYFIIICGLLSNLGNFPV